MTELLLFLGLTAPPALAEQPTHEQLELNLARIQIRSLTEQRNNYHNELQKLKKQLKQQQKLTKAYIYSRNQYINKLYECQLNK